MRYLKLLLVTNLITLIALIVIVGNGGSPIGAANSQQEVTRLDGYQIYFTEEDREASPFDRSDEGLSHLAGLLRSLGADLYAVDWRLGIPEDADLVVMAGPIRYVGAPEIARIWHYLNKGGSLLLLVGPLAPTTDTEGNVIIDINRSIAPDGGFFELAWTDYGVRTSGDVVVKLLSPAELVTDITTTSFGPDHPIVTGLSNPLTFFVATSINYDASVQTYRTTPLVYSGTDYYGEASFGAYLVDGTVEFDEGIDKPGDMLTLAVASENLTTGSRIVIIGDRDFATNGKGLQTSPVTTAGFLYPGNVYFLLNTVAWLVRADASQNMEMIFPTPGPTATSTPVPTPSS